MDSDRPLNVLFITVDQWRGDCLSLLGHPCVKTPNLDALAGDGVAFRNHFCQALPCSPSRASLYTGLYQHNHRVARNGTPLDARHTNIALEVRKAGYDPELFGYTDTAPDPRTLSPGDRALTTYGGVLPGMTLRVQHAMGDAMPWHAYLAERGYALPDKLERLKAPGPDYPNAEGRGPTFAPPVYSAEDSDMAFLTGEVLRNFARGAQDPWFVHLSYLNPHPPFIVPEPYNAMFDPEEVPEPIWMESPEAEAGQHPLAAYYLANVKVESFILGRPGLAADLSLQDLKQLRATYYGMMAEMDAQIGRLLDDLKARGEYDRTLIVLTSDHGEQLGDRRQLGKQGYHDQSFHVPLIVRLPGERFDAARGTIVDAFSENVDVMPTILDCLGMEVPVACDGESLLPFLEGRLPANWRKAAHYEFDFREVLGGGPGPALGLKPDQCSLAVLRDDQYKYVHFAGLPPLFFDLREDPHQFRNLAADPAYAPLLRDYALEMLSWRMRHNDRTLTGMAVGPGGVTERREARQ